jgi:hypothetical protein
VLLPEPDSPTSPSVSPRRMAKVTSSAARTSRPRRKRPRRRSLAGLTSRLRGPSSAFGRGERGHGGEERLV